MYHNALFSLNVLLISNFCRSDPNHHFVHLATGVFYNLVRDEKTWKLGQLLPGNHVYYQEPPSEKRTLHSEIIETFKQQITKGRHLRQIMK